MHAYILTPSVAAGSNPPGLEPHPEHTTERERETYNVLQQIMHHVSKLERKNKESILTIDCINSLCYSVCFSPCRCRAGEKLQVASEYNINKVPSYPYLSTQRFSPTSPTA